MHFDEINGNVPLLFFPDETFQNNEKFMDLFKFHLPWFLDSEDKTNVKYVSLEYYDKIFLARICRISSNMGRERNLFLEFPFDTIIVTVLVPKEVVSYGLNFLNVVTELFFQDYKEMLNYIFLSEIL
jgi:hypothetical protein